MNISGVYKAASISALPVDPIEAAKAMGIKTVRYSDMCVIYKRSMTEMYRLSRLGFSYAENGAPIIAVNENACGERRRRFTVAHELGHCLLGHITDGRKPTGVEERAADRFAADLLAPLAVLRLCEVGSVEETARLCGITMSAAEIRFEELMRFREIGDEDLRIIMRFSEFIDRYLQCRGSNRGGLRISNRY